MKFIKYLLLLSVSILVCACAESDTQTPEQQVRAVLSTIEEAVEARSLSSVLEHVSDDYQDHQGNDKKAVARLVQFQILRNQNINIFSVVQSIDVNNSQASVELSAAIAAKGVDLSLESNRLKADAYRFSVLLKQQSEKWLIQSVSWQRGWQ